MLTSNPHSEWLNKAEPADHATSNAEGEPYMDRHASKAPRGRLMSILVRPGKAMTAVIALGLIQVFLAVVPVSAAPAIVVRDDSYVTPPNTTLTVAAPGVRANDDPAAAPNQAIWLTTPDHFTMFELGPAGDLTYTPADGFIGVDSFTYCLGSRSGSGAGCVSNVATVTLSVPGIVARNDSYTTPPNTTLTVAAPGVRANDDPAAAPNLVIRLTVPDHFNFFKLGLAGDLTYTPADGFVGVDTFTYCLGISVFSGSGCASNVATVTVRVTETVKTTPTISTSASPGNLVGTPVRDIATLAGGVVPTGNVTFRLFADASCTVMVFSSSNSLSGLTATSDWFTPISPGTYRWTAVYSGDSQNSTATSPCNAANESVTLAPFQAPTYTRTMTGDLPGGLTVNAGESVLVGAGVRLSGPVTVNPGGALTVTDAKISGGVTADRPSFLSICGSEISALAPSAALRVTNSPTPIRSNHSRSRAHAA